MTSSILAIVLVSAAIHALWSMAIKGSGDPLVFNLAQELAPIAVFLVVLPWVDFQTIPTAIWPLLAGTGAVHAFYFFWMSRAYQYGDLTLVYPIARSTPAFLPLIAVPLFGESISIGGAMGIATVVGGMWLVSLGGEKRGGLRLGAFRTKAVGYATLTLAATVAYSLLDKQAMTLLAASTWTNPLPRAAFFVIFLGAANAIVFVPLAFARSGMPAADLWRGVKEHLWRATAAAGVSYAGYALILTALETAPVSYVVAVRQVSVLFALLLGVFWLGERPGRLRLIGACAMLTGVVSIAVL